MAPIVKSHDLKYGYVQMEILDETTGLRFYVHNNKLADKPILLFPSGMVALVKTLRQAYQIYDDLADFFGREQRIGKTLGTDLASGKLTLPLLFLRDRLPEAERAGLEAELEGRAAPRLEQRLAEMGKLGVFAAVTAEIEAELALAEAALAEHPGLAPAGHLAALPLVLRAQVTALG
jgi:octaprenyl-diphosphate synthase